MRPLRDLAALVFFMVAPFVAIGVAVKMWPDDAMVVMTVAVVACWSAVMALGIEGVTD